MSGHGNGGQAPALERGDILLKRADLFSPAHLAIALGQKFGGSSKATTVHAAIYVGSDHIAESSTAGLAVAPLDGLATWKVFRLAKNNTLAPLAATVAMHLVDRARRTAGFGAYSMSSAARSALDEGRNGNDVTTEIADFANQALSEIGGDGREFFCSNFVVQCYSIASEYDNAGSGIGGGLYMIPLDHERTSPADLAEFFDDPINGWYKVGEMRG